MKLVLDMNLSPEWESVFSKASIDAIHWSRIGQENAKDSEIMLWAKENAAVVFTHDLDFSALLASTNAKFPSVIQLRDLDITPSSQGDFVVRLLKNYEREIMAGSILSIDKANSRIRILPLRT